MARASCWVRTASPNSSADLLSGLQVGLGPAGSFGPLSHGSGIGLRPALGGELASDERWILTDQYPDETRHRALILYHPATNRRIDIGRFYAPPELDGPTRCDLHPRWSRDGRSVCIDSVHEGTRGMYVADVSDIVG